MQLAQPKLTWKLLDTNKATSPVPRNSHVSVVEGDNLYILGGQDDENNKLDDLWQFNIPSQTWTQIQYSQGAEELNVGRSGHAAVAYGGKMYVFGGILEVTKELNDLLAFNYQSKSFQVVDANGDVDHQYISKYDDNLTATKVQS